jgi:hypothetical protein
MYETIEKQRQDIREWLYGSADPAENHRSAKGNREPLTGEWFLERDEYTDWKNNRKRLLWLYGIRKSAERF